MKEGEGALKRLQNRAEHGVWTAGDSMTTRSYRVRAIDRLGAAAALWLLISAASDAVGVLWAIGDIYVWSNLDRLPMVLLETWDRIALIGFAQTAVYVVAVFMVAKWTYRASANVHASGRPLETSPPWAVGWYFIPVANLWKPYQALAEIVRATVTSSSGLPMGLWWGLWLATSISGNISFRLTLRAVEPNEVIVASAFTLVSSATGLGAALALRRIIVAVTKAQTERQQTLVF